MQIYHRTCQIDYPELLYEMIEELPGENNFRFLIPYPCLLLKWQTHHPKDNKRIMTICSHILNHHTYCETPEKCFTVETFLNKYGIKTV